MSYKIEDINKYLEKTEYIVIDYKNNRTLSTFKHKKCGGTFQRSWATMKKSIDKNTIVCPCCKESENTYKTKSYSLCEINEKLKDTDFEILYYAGNNKSNSLFLHKTCGETFERRLDAVLRGIKNKRGITCPHCTIKGSWKAHTKEDVVKMLEGSKYQLVGDYIIGHEKTTFLHKTCGETFEATLVNVLKSIREDIDSCINCVKSESSKATFAKEECKKIFKEVICEWRICKNPKTNCYLPFDIYIHDINTVIEIMGQQHYKKGFGCDEKEFQYIKWKDNFKKEWCIKNDVNYIDIDIRKYTEEDIKKIIVNLKNFNDYRKHI